MSIMYCTKKYLTGPKAGKKFRVQMQVGPYASMVLEAQQRRNGKPTTPVPGPDGKYIYYNYRMEP